MGNVNITESSISVCTGKHCQLETVVNWVREHICWVNQLITYPWVNGLNSGCRPRFVNAELDPGGRGKELVGKGLDTVRARLATVRARLVILNKICENL